MSITILEFANSFVKGRVSAATFVDAFSELWKIERDGKILQNDDEQLNERLSTIFCLVDLFNPREEKEAYELDTIQLREKISTLLKNQSAK